MHSLKRFALTTLAAAGLAASLSACKEEAKAPPPAAAPPAATPPAATPPAAAPAATGSGSAAAAPAAAAPAAGGAASITGSVMFTGTAPDMKNLPTSADPKCPKSVKDESVIVKGGKLGNVWVRVTKGAPAATAPAEAIEVDQDGCMYKPRMAFAVVGQKIVLKNHDDTLHNVHAYLGAATAFNKGMPGKAAAPIEYTPTDEGMVKLKCDVHPWMRGFVGVAKTNLQASTNDSGDFTINNVPAGTYTIEAWHEKYGSKTADVTVTAGAPAKVEIKYDGTEKGT